MGGAPPGGGGGILCRESNPIITNCTVSGNMSDGISCLVSNPTITNCRITGNTYGAGISCRESNPIITNCIITGNIAEEHGYGSGDGIYCYYSNPTITNCTIAENQGSGIRVYNGSLTAVNCIITGNRVNRGGGGILCEDSTATIANCTISGNTAEWGAGICCYYGSTTITNCAITGNSAESPYAYGGAIFCAWGSQKITNCIITGNKAKWGGGIDFGYCNPIITNCVISSNEAEIDGGGINCTVDSNSIIANCILWSNTASQGNQIAVGHPDYPEESTLTVSYSDVQGGQDDIYVKQGCMLHWGEGNIDADPCFVEPGYWADVNDPNIVVEPNDPNAVWVDGDYHLQSFGWRWDTLRKVWTWDDVTSRCIDAGNPGSPLGEELLSVPVDPNNEWGQNLRINMGAFGGTSEASMPPYDWALLANLTNDGKVDSNDLAAFVNYWLDSGECIPSDLSRNQFVDFIDFALLGQDWFLETSWYTDPCVPDDMVYIPDGEFEMGDHFDEGDSDELPLHAALLDSFFMGKFEITNQQYCDYLNSAYPAQIKVDGGVVYASSDDPCDYPYCDTHGYDADSQIDYNDVSGTFSVREKGGRDMSNDPMVEVSWYGAAAYCNWRSSEEGYESCYNLSTWDCNFSKHGYRLATEAEWEYAARGGEHSPYYRFPWGDTISHSQGNYHADPCSYSYDVSPTEGYHPDYNDVMPYTAPVGSFSANGYGLYDMTGNVGEWCNDWCDGNYYNVSLYDNPTGPASGTYRLLRGGGWSGLALGCRVAYRYSGVPSIRLGLGFRIVLDLN
ncbi:Hercynine oxygenase [subsurface metagenome]